MFVLVALLACSEPRPVEPVLALEGSVAREGDRVAVTAQLIDATNETNLWGERYEQEIASILTVQGDVARAIGGEIQITLTPAVSSGITAAVARRRLTTSVTMNGASQARWPCNGCQARFRAVCRPRGSAIRTARMTTVRRRAKAG